MSQSATRQSIFCFENATNCQADYRIMLNAPPSSLGVAVSAGSLAFINLFYLRLLNNTRLQLLQHRQKHFKELIAYGICHARNSSCDNWSGSLCKDESEDAVLKFENEFEIWFKVLRRKENKKRTTYQHYHKKTLILPSKIKTNESWQLAENCSQLPLRWRHDRSTLIARKFTHTKHPHPTE